MDNPFVRYKATMLFLVIYLVVMDVVPRLFSGEWIDMMGIGAALLAVMWTIFLDSRKGR